MTRLTFREATPDDVPELAALHVVTWAATYPHVARPPTFEIRERQWRDAFAQQDGTWFCYLAVDPSAAPERRVGFAKGQDYLAPELPDFSGELNKIYLLQDYQRRGWGRQLLGHIVRRFLDRGIHSMVLFADAQNPSCRFYEALGAERLLVTVNGPPSLLGVLRGCDGGGRRRRAVAAWSSWSREAWMCWGCDWAQ